MDVLDENLFAYDNLDSVRKRMKSEMAAHRDIYDSDYAMFLKMQFRCSSVSSSDDGGSGTSGGECDVGGEDEEDDDEGQMDTHFKMFLENLKADGVSYVLKRRGKPDLKFEGMDEGSDGNEANVVDQAELSSDCESDVRRRRGYDVDGRSGGTRDKGILRAGGVGNVKENRKAERRANGGQGRTFVENDEDFLAEGVDVMQEKRGGRTVKNVPSGEDCAVENVDLRLVKRGARDFKDVGNKQTSVENNKYRSVEEVDLTQVKRIQKNVDKKHSFEENESDSSVKEAAVRLDGTQFSRSVEELKGIVKNGERQRNLKKYQYNNSVEGVNLRSDGSQFCQDVEENGKPERRAKNFKNVEKQKIFTENERDSSLLGHVKRCLSKGEYVEPDYKTFLDLCEVEGDDLVFVANGKRLIYGKDDSTSLSDSEVYVLDHAPDCIESNYAPTLNFNSHMEDDDLQCLGSCNPAENPLFRKAVMDILRKPFDEKEYRRLRKDVKRRKLITRHVDMRSGNTSFQQTTMGKSYLDHYDDLKQQYDAFKYNNPKRLNILRGFFFYLQRMADDGKFKPWLDESCLTIVPRIS